MEQSSTKKYLKECHERIVEHALNCGLDPECYHLYLSEVLRALPGDSGVRRKFQEMLNGSASEIFARIMGGDGAWQTQYYDEFKKQWLFMEELLAFIEHNAKDEETMTIARAQVSFMRMQLHYQKRHLDTIMFHTPSKYLFEAKDSIFADALAGNSRLEALVMGKWRALEEAKW